MDLDPMELDEGDAEQRASFVVRLSFAQGQPRRTEIQHVQTGKKEIFPGLDVQRLASFMKVCIRLAAIPEPAIPPASPPPRVATPTPEPSRPVAEVTISDVRVSRLGRTDVITLTLSRDEAFAIQVHFHLQGSGALALAAQGSSFEIKAYANEMTVGTPRLLTTFSANLVKGAFDYTAQMQAPGLPSGLHRVVTLLTLDTPVKMVVYHEGPVVEITET
jgi:hypothetical protein